MAAIGWYGPLIDLSKAASHLDDFVQLLVFVHRSQSVQKVIASNGRKLIKTDIQVGDDTRSYFSVSLWQKHMGSMVVAGDVILLQNVKIVKFRDVLEGATVQISSLLVLVHPYELIASKGSDELVTDCQQGEITRNKLRRVIEWVQRTESAVQHVQQAHSFEKKWQPMKNWKAHEEKKSLKCLSISEVLRLTNSCNANVYACIAEILLPLTWSADQVEKEKLFVSRRLCTMNDNNIAEDLICTGCKLCGSPVSSRSFLEQDKFPLYCPKSSKYHHNVSLIYRPFRLYVRDQTEQIPLLVKDKAAEVLFGNITAEKVYKCYQQKRKDHNPDLEGDCELHHSNVRSSSHSKVSRDVGHADGNQQLRCTVESGSGGERKKLNFYGIWLILLKLLLQQGKNSPFRFEIAVDWEKDLENGRFELVSLTMPFSRTGKS